MDFLTKRLKENDPRGLLGTTYMRPRISVTAESVPRPIDHEKIGEK